MDTPYNKPNRWSYFNKHYPELTYYFEYIDQSNSGYDICRNVSANKNSILFELKENAIEGIESIEIVIENSHTIENWEEFKTIFDEIFSDI